MHAFNVFYGRALRLTRILHTFALELILVVIQPCILTINEELMKAKIFAALAVLAVCSIGSARAEQPLPVQEFEGGVDAAMTVPVGNFHDLDHKLCVGFGAEFRHNIRRTGFDVGMRLGFNMARYEPHGDSYQAQSDGVVYAAAVGDYNFRQGRKVNPFAGLGIGVGFYDTTSGGLYNSNGTAAVFIPRIGVELVHHIRVTASMHILRNGFNTFDISLGFVIGGRPRSAKAVAD